jgi:hypothetical protein
VDLLLLAKFLCGSLHTLVLLQCHFSLHSGEDFRRCLLFGFLLDFAGGDFYCLAVLVMKIGIHLVGGRGHTSNEKEALVAQLRTLYFTRRLCPR